MDKEKSDNEVNEPLETEKESQTENNIEKDTEKENEKEKEIEIQQNKDKENEAPYQPFIPDSKKKRKYTTSILDDDNEEDKEKDDELDEKEKKDEETKELTTTTTTSTSTNSLTTTTTTTTTTATTIKSKREKKEKKVKKKRVKKSIEENYEEIEPTEVNNYTLGDLVKKRIIGDTMKSTLEREKATRENQQQILNHHRRSLAQQKVARLNGEEPSSFNGGVGEETNAPAIEFVNGQLVIKQNTQDGDYAYGDAPVLQDGQDHITNNSYSKRTVSKRWSEAETQDFFIQLKRYGTDFSVLEKVFPHRTRRQLKSKFKKEQNDNPNLLDDILKGRIDYNIEDYKRQRDHVAKQQKDREEQKKKIDDILKMGGDASGAINEDDDEDDEDYRDSINKGANGSGNGGISGAYRPAVGKYQEEVVIDSQTYESQQAQQQNTQNYDPYAMENDNYNTNEYEY
ncbi:hypothetical protein ACTFIU_000845 [Dictyostelium citrinum]